MGTKATKIIDLNLFSGSSERLRQVAGGYYRDAAGTGEITFFDADIVTNINGVESAEYTEIDSSTSTILPRIRYVSRLNVDEAQGFESDEEWKTFIIGGIYDNKRTYGGIYNERVYADHYNTSSLPLLPREVINVPSEEPSLSLTTEYYNYYPRFQTEVGNLNSELEAPNFYLLSSASYLRPSENTGSTQSRYQYSDLAEFLTDGYINLTKSLDTRMENIFVLDRVVLDENNDTRLDTTDLLVHGGFDSDLSSLYSLMPFGNKLFIDASMTKSRSDYTKIIQNHNFETKFIKLLKEVFQGESRLQTSTVNFAVNTDATVSTGILAGSLETTTTVPVRLVDAPTMLLYSYRNPTSETQNISIINSSSYRDQEDYAMDTTGIYRYENTSASLGVLNQFASTISNKFQDAISREGITNLESLLKEANVDKYYETVAFRIEKIGGGPTGDSNTENTVQNIWLFNRDNEGALTYFDTQVKYDTEYTYKIYKYDIVQGYKYQLSDAVVTRQIATEGEGADKIYCLEFYDPFTGQTTPQLFSDDNLASNYEQMLSNFSEISNIFNDTSALFPNLVDTAEELYNLYIEDTSYDQYAVRKIFDEDAAGYSATRQGEVGLYFGYVFLSKTLGAVLDDIQTLIENMSNQVYDQEFKEFFLTKYPELLSLIEELTTDQESRVGVDAIVNRLTQVDQLLALGEDLFTLSPDSSTLTPDELLNIEQISQEMILETAGLEINVNNRLLLSNTKILYNKLFQFVNLPNRPEKLSFFRDIVQAQKGILENYTSSDLQELSDLVSETALLLRTFNTTATEAQTNSYYSHLADFNVTVEPSLKIIEIPLEEKSMRIVDHPPNDFVVTPHHLLDQSNRLAFYCKYDTFYAQTMLHIHQQ